MATQPAEAKIERIIVEKNNGKKLVGVLHETGSPGITVMCHGFRSSKASKTIVEITGALVEQNLSAFRFDFSGNGESNGEFHYSNYWGEVDDLRAVIQYFTGKGREISAILGHSKGANVVLLYASKYHDVPAVVNVSARYNLDRGMEERFGISFMETLVRDGYIDVKKKKNGKPINFQFYYLRSFGRGFQFLCSYDLRDEELTQKNNLNFAGEVDYRVTLQSVLDRLEINMEVSCSQIDQECRVLTVHGSKDEITPLGDAFLFHRIVPNHVTHIIEGANHCYTWHRDELNSAILSFLRDG